MSVQNYLLTKVLGVWYNGFSARTSRARRKQKNRVLRLYLMKPRNPPINMRGITERKAMIIP